MIRLMLNTYSMQERDKLAYHLESVQKAIALDTGCHSLQSDCRICQNRHICTDLLAASVYAKDYKPDTK